MKNLPPHIAAGYKRLRLMVICGLILPIGLGLYIIWQFVLVELTESTGFRNIVFDGLVLAIVLIPIGIGLFIGSKMLKGKIWANTLWSVVGTLIGVTLLIVGIGGAAFMGNLSALLIAGLGAYITLICYQCVYNKEIEAFFDYINKPQAEALIDEIGTQ